MVEIIKSASDRKLYRYIEFENGLKVVLIQDPEIVPNQEDAGAGGLPRNPKAALGEDFEDVEQLVSDDEGASSDSQSEGSSGSASDSEFSSGSDSSDASGHVRPHIRRGGKRSSGAASATVKKAAAALSVASGSLSDPWDLQGLSHFLEHMLFMGSERFPEENAYDAYLASHGGSSNAFTDLEATTYYFDVAPDSLPGALERFCEFFVAPLVRTDALKRELQAVDSEFSSAVQSDGARLEALRSHSARGGHIYRKFAWGNAKSLGAKLGVDGPSKLDGKSSPKPGGKKLSKLSDGSLSTFDGGSVAEIATGPAAEDTRERLLAHAVANYGAERSSLVVLSGESLDIVEARVREAFGRIDRGPGPRIDLKAQGPPFEGGVAHVVRSVRDEHRLAFAIALPPLRSRFECKADEYLAHLIGHEAHGSLLDALKRRGWATELSAGVVDVTTISSVFEIAITLTASGLHAGRGAGLEVIELAARYFALLRTTQPEKWVWDELADVARMRFRFVEEEDAADFVTTIATDLHSLPPEHVLDGDFLYGTWNPQLINELLCMMKISGMRIDLQTRDYDVSVAALKEVVPNVTVEHEPWFDFTYLRAPLPEELLFRLDTANPGEEFRLSQRNPFVATSFDLVSGSKDKAADDPDASEATCRSQPATPPTLLLDGPGLRAWHKQDTHFLLPRTNTYLRFSSAEMYGSPRAAALTHLVLRLLEDDLCETLYFADLAGISCSTWFEGLSGLDIKLEGFSEKLPLLAESVFAGIKALNPPSDVFDRVLEALRRQYGNINVNPSKHATYLRLLALNETTWHAEEVLKALEDVQVGDVSAFIKTLLSAPDLHIEALVHGNISAEDAAHLARAVRAALGAPPATQDRCKPERTLLLGEAQSAILHRTLGRNPEDTNSVTELYLQAGLDDDERRALLDLVEQVIGEPVYDTLRTKEQLGYTVHAGVRVTHGILGFAVVVVSGKYGAVHVDDRIEAFLEAYRTTLTEMSPSDFEENKQSLISAKLQKDRTMLDESDRSWEAICTRRYHFEARDREVAVLRSTSKEQLVAYYDKVIRPSSPLRCKLCIHVVPHSRKEELSAPAPAGTEIVDDLDNLKARFPFARPPARTPGPARFE